MYVWSGSKLEGESLKRGTSFFKTCNEAGIEAVIKDLGDETTVDDNKIRMINRFLEQRFRTENLYMTAYLPVLMFWLLL